MFVTRRRPRHGERGQALIETGIALPLVLVTLFGIIFFDRLGIVSERTQRAVRYGAEVVPPPTYLPQMYEAMWKALSQYNGQFQNATNAGCDALIKPQVEAAVTNNEKLPSTLVGAQTFWQPTTAAVATCTLSTVHVPNTSQFNEVFTLGISQALVVNVNAPVTPPGYLASILATYSPNATDFSLAPVTPAIVMSCTPTMTDPIVEVMWPSFSPYRQSYLSVTAFKGQPVSNSNYHADKVC